MCKTVDNQEATFTLGCSEQRMLYFGHQHTFCTTVAFSQKKRISHTFLQLFNGLSEIFRRHTQSSVSKTSSHFFSWKTFLLFGLHYILSERKPRKRRYFLRGNQLKQTSSTNNANLYHKMALRINSNVKELVEEKEFFLRTPLISTV